MPSVTSSICQSAGLNSGGVVRENATVSTTSTAVGPYVQQLSGGGGSSSSTGGSVIKINIVNGGSGYRDVVPTLQITGGGGSGATAICTVSGGSINSVTITNAGSGYTSAPTVIVTPVLGIVNLQAVISTSSSSSSPSASFQQVVDNDPKIILLK